MKYIETTLFMLCTVASLEIYIYIHIFLLKIERVLYVYYKKFIIKIINQLN